MRRAELVWAPTLGGILAALSVAYLLSSANKPALVVLLAVEIAGGREASIPAGIAGGLSWQEASTAAALIELTSLFLLFPLLVALAAGLHRVRWLESALARAQAFAARRPDVDVLALCGLTLMPFLPVGALTSVLVGELLRLPARWLIPGLALTLVVANASFGYLAGALLARTGHPQIVAAAMSTLLLVGAGIAWLVHRRIDARPP